MADGCALRVRDNAEGNPALVLLHGYLETIEVWEEFIPLLRGLRTVAVDLPGHGISEVKGPVHTMEFLARTVRAALDAVGVGECYVAGHSMGGYVALELLRLFPSTVKGLILLHSTPNADSPEKQENRAREIALVEAGKKELLARTAPEAGFAPENRRRLAAAIEELSENVMLEEDAGIIALLRGMATRRDNNDTLEAHPGTPLMFVFGRHDGHISAETAESMLKSHPRARAVWLERSGHMGFIEEPDETASAILEFTGRADRAECLNGLSREI